MAHLDRIDISILQALQTDGSLTNFDRALKYSFYV